MQKKAAVDEVNAARAGAPAQANTILRGAILDTETPELRAPGELRRVLSLPLITFYGLGTILGAGIYVLVGKVAGVAGLYAPLAFMLAAVTAGLTGFAYAELSSRHPLSGGEAVYMQEAFGLRAVSTAVGLLIVLSGLVSAATISRGFVGYLRVFVDLPDTMVIVGVVAVLGVLAAWGILQSAAVAAVATVIEIGGLVLILIVAGDVFGTLPQRLPELVPPAQAVAWEGIFLGAFLAFYAFIGFEDMVNVAEEVKDPVRNLPRAIVLALVIATILYLAVSLVSVLSLPLDELASSAAPLAQIFERATGQKPFAIALISLFAVLNGALIQIIMASRMLYGMSREGWLPGRLGKVHARTQTPLMATGVIVAAVLAFALLLPLVTLAKVTSFVVLVVFVLISLALIRLKRAGPPPPGVYTVPAWVPYASLCSALALLAVQTAELSR